MNKVWLVVMLLCAAVLGACAQLAFKSSNAKFDQSILTNWTLYFGIFMMVVAFVINLYAYQQGASVTMVYPTLAASYVFAVVLAWMVLGESLTLAKITGASFIVLGIVTMWM